MKNVLKACSLCSCAVPPPAASPLDAPGTSGSPQFPPPHSYHLTPLHWWGTGVRFCIALQPQWRPSQTQRGPRLSAASSASLDRTRQWPPLPWAGSAMAHCGVTQQGPLAHLQCRHPASRWLQSLSACPSTCGLGGGTQEGRLTPHPQQGPCILHWTYKLQSQLCVYNSVSSGHREKGMLSGNGLMWTP